MAYTLAQMLDEIESQLNDTGNAVWSTALLTRAVAAALQEINRTYPRLVAETISAADATREYDLSVALSQPLLAVTAVWYPYDSAYPYPPSLPNWRMLADTILYLMVAEDPSSGEEIRVFYLAPHTISGLESATASTLNRILEELVIEGACAHAVAIKAADAINKINTDRETPQQWREEADRRLRQWYARLSRIRRDPGDARAGPWPVDRWD